MIVYRICKSKFQNDLSGTGAEISGGRWNSKGIPIVYTSESIALCMLEVLAHIPKTSVPNDFVLVSIDLPGATEIKEVKPSSLPKGWNEFPFKPATQKAGDSFVKNAKALILKVPSSLVPDSYNYLLNPFHPDMKKVRIIKVQKSPFDMRLFN